MYETYFSLCGVPILVRSAEPMRSDAHARFFETPPAAPTLTVTVEPVPEIAVPAAQLRRSDSDTVVWQSDTCVTLAKRMSRTAAPYAAVSYDIRDPAHAALSVRTDAADWAAHPPQLWSAMALHQLLAPFGALIIHASYVRVGSRAVLFTAPCGMGKSTQARLWAEHRGAAVINGDKAGLRLVDGILHAYGMPICGTSGICENVTLPVAAIVQLSQAKTSAVRRLAPSAAVQAVSANIYAEQCIPWQNALETVLQIAASTPVLHLSCTPDETAVSALERALREERGL